MQGLSWCRSGAPDGEAYGLMWLEYDGYRGPFERRSGEVFTSREGTTGVVISDSRLNVKEGI